MEYNTLNHPQHRIPNTHHINQRGTKNMLMSELSKKTFLHSWHIENGPIIP